MKFKVGDRVFVKRLSGLRREGVIVNIDFPTRQLKVNFDEEQWCWYTAESLELSVEQTYMVLFVTHDDDYNKKKYIFGIERDISIGIGDKLFADTRYGKSVVTAVCEPFEINEHGLNQLSKIHGGYGKLKYITGKAVKGYTEEPF